MRLYLIMGLREASAYISALRRRQDDPLAWPDFLTGLPDRAATIRKANEVYPRLGSMGITYLKIANIEPYLAKYGTARHVEIIEWAAAALKTTMDRYKGFVGVIDRHEFIAICKAAHAQRFVDEAKRLFNSKARKLYGMEDLAQGEVLSFTNGRRKVSFGLMELKHYTADARCDVPPTDLVSCLRRNCR